LMFQEFQHPTYPQGDGHPAFVPYLSAIDLVMWRAPGGQSVPDASQGSAGDA